MALNWKSAQKSEKLFWKNIYIKKIFDKVYAAGSNEQYVEFVKEIFKRHKINIKKINKKVLLYLGSGPYGLIKGLTFIEKKSKLKIKSLIAIDPLMNFYKKKINLLKQDSHLRLINGSGENIPLKNNSVDFLFCTNVIDHCSLPSKVITESARVLSNNGVFCPSVHVIYPYLNLFRPLLKYVDKNHPHHFSEKYFEKILKKNFSIVQKTFSATIIKDQPSFTFSNIFSDYNFFKNLKRAISNYIVYTIYYVCKK